MGFMLSIMAAPVILFPSLEMTAEIAQPDGMRTCPSKYFMCCSPFRFDTLLYKIVKKRTLSIGRAYLSCGQTSLSVLVYHTVLASLCQCTVSEIERSRKGSELCNFTIDRLQQ